MKQRVLFVGIHNDARSQMAEAFLNAAFPARFEAHSAGLHPTPLNPLMIEAMREIGFDISKSKSTSVFDLINCNERFELVITVCDDASGQRCPAFPSNPKRLHWGFADPAAYQGTREERLAFMRHVRDEIKDQVAHWCTEQRNASWNPFDAVEASQMSANGIDASCAAVPDHRRVEVR
jgi:arsenate reductase